MKILLATLACVMAAGLTQAQPSRFSREKYIENGDTLAYRLLFPDANRQRKYPLVIFLHGSGERGSDNDAQLKWGVMNFATDQNMIAHPAIVIAPQCPEGQRWSNETPDRTRTRLTLNAEPSTPMRLLIGLIHQLETKMPVDTNRIYITGLSMGGYGTYDALERYPHLFAAAVPVCGAGDTSRAASIAHIPMWIYLGAEDPAVNPLFGLDMLEALTHAGAHPGFTQYPEVGHFSWLGAYSDPLMMEWLFKQHKAEAVTIHQEAEFAVTPGRLYQVLLSSEQFSACTKKSFDMFTATSAKIDPREGGTFSLFDGHIIGRILELVPDKRIVEAWRVVDWPAGVYSIATFDLEPKGAGTHLRFDHTGFPADLKEHLAAGWQEHYWAALNKYFQTH